MNELNLSRRLETVASYIKKGSVLADIGSDHAYLPCYAYLKGLITKGIVGEITEGPLESAKRQISKNSLDSIIEARKGDGLEVIQPNEVDCITIAGMGGGLISAILESGREKLAGVERLILQPNIGGFAVRDWLLKNDWEIIAEEIIEEDHKIYEIIVAERGNPYRPYQDADVELLVGPFLGREKNPVFMKKWKHELQHWEKIVKQLEQADKNLDNQKRKSELLKKIALVKGVIE